MCDHGFAEVVEKEKEVNENDNTFLAYDSKKKEFMEFCDHICHPPMSSEHKYKVTPDKIYNFLFFQSRRGQYKTGRKKNAPTFIGNNYDNLLMNPNWCAEKPLGFDGVNQYKCALIEIHQYEVDKGLTDVTREQLLSRRVAELMNNVKLRYDTNNEAFFVIN